MAKIIPSALVSDIRGKMAGTVFQGSSQGLQMRVKPTGSKSGTAAQYKVRSLNSQVNKAWAQLSNDQRTLWKSVSDYYNGIGLTSQAKASSNSGRMQFMTINFYSLLYGKSIITNPEFGDKPQPFEPCPPENYSCTSIMETGGLLDTTREILITKVSRPQSNSSLRSNSGFRTLVYPQVDGSMQDWATAYENTYGVPLQYNAWYWIELQVLNYITGALGPKAVKRLYYTEAVSGIGYWTIGGTFIVY